MSGADDRLRDEAPTSGDTEVARIRTLLDLEPLSHEGGWYRRTHADGHGTAIYYLLGPDDASALHRLPQAEIWHHYAGAEVQLLTLDDRSGTPRSVVHRLGDELFDGAVPQVLVPAGVWQGAISTGAWSLLGTTMAPGYEQAGFDLGDPGELRARFPDAAGLIDEITRRSSHLFDASS